jgi:hypothetical protein
MTYFGNIFISSYRVYKRTEKHRSPRFTSTVLLSICFDGILFMMIAILLRLSNTPNSSISFLGNYPFITIVVAFLQMFLIYNYFSEKRIEALNASFEQKKLFERRMWGYAVVISLILPWIIGPILFNK